MNLFTSQPLLAKSLFTLVVLQAFSGFGLPQLGWAKPVYVASHTIEPVLTSSVEISAKTQPSSVVFIEPKRKHLPLLAANPLQEKWVEKGQGKKQEKTLGFEAFLEQTAIFSPSAANAFNPANPTVSSSSSFQAGSAVPFYGLPPGVDEALLAPLRGSSASSLSSTPASPPVPMFQAVQEPTFGTGRPDKDGLPLAPLNPVPNASLPNPSETQVQKTEVATLYKKQSQTGPLKLEVIRGRSQLVKFAQPIRRVSLAEPTLADIVPLSPTELMINGKQRGTTSLVVWDENNEEGIFELRVVNDTSEVLSAIEAIAPDEAIELRVTDDSLMVSGQASNSVVLEEIRRIAAAYGYRDNNFIDLTETPVPQVSLEVRIAEANRSSLKELKVGMATQISDNFGFTKIDSVSPDSSLRVPAAFNQALLYNQQAGTNSRLAAGALGAGNSTNVGGGLFNFSPGFGGNFNFQMRLDALETEGKISLLAEPNLVCTHGRTASFLVGGEFPFVSGVSQNGQPVIQFKEYGIRLRFTPWIATRSGRVEMRVEPEVSSIDTTTSQNVNGTVVFGILSRRTDTTVEMQDGESLLISGLLTRDETDSLQKVPFIADVPVLGTLFRNRNNSAAERELIVVVTPHILKQGGASGNAYRILGTSSSKPFSTGASTRKP